MVIVGTNRVEAQPSGDMYEIHRGAHDPTLVPERDIASDEILLPQLGLIISPWFDRTLTVRGSAALANGRYQQAIDAFRQHLDITTIEPVGTARTYLQWGKAEFKRGRYESARLAMNEAISAVSAEQEIENADPIVADALFWIALSHLSDRTQPEAKCADILDESLQRAPEGRRSADAHYVLGIIYERAENYSRAIDEYEQVMRIDPAYWDEFSLRLRIIQSHIAMSDDAGTASELGRLRARSPDPSTAAIQGETLDSNLYAFYLLLGEFELKRGHYTEAEGAFLPLLGSSISEYRRRGLLGLGDTYAAAGRGDSAIAIYRRLVDENRWDATGQRAEYSLAAALLRWGNESDGIAALTNVAGTFLHPHGDHALLDLGLYHMRDGQYDTAAGYFRKSIKQASDDDIRRRGIILLGNTYIHRSQWDSAVAVLARATSGVDVKTGELDILVEYLGGIALVRAGRPAEAIVLLNRVHLATRDSAIDEATGYWLGEAFYDTKHYDRAVEQLETLVRRNPSSPFAQQALYTIGWAYLRQQNFRAAESAFAMLAKAYPVGPRTVEAQIRRAEALYALKEYSEAANVFASIAHLSASPAQHAYADYQLPVALYRAGRYHEAWIAAERFIECHGDSPLLADADMLRAAAAMGAERFDLAERAILSVVSRSPRQILEGTALLQLAVLAERRYDSGATSAVREYRAVSDTTGVPDMPRMAAAMDAWGAMQRGDTTAAIQIFRELAAGIDGASVATLVTVAKGLVALVARGDADALIGGYGAATLLLTADILAAEGANDSAVTIYSSLANGVGREGRYSRLATARLALRRNDIRGARSILEGLLSEELWEDSLRTDVRLELADVYLLVSEPRYAAVLYRKIIDEHCNGKARNRAELQLSTLQQDAQNNGTTAPAKP